MENLVDNNMGLDWFQTKLLNILLDKYEHSKSYNGVNKVNQNFFCGPNDIVDDYASDFADIHIISDFHTSMKRLEEKHLIHLEWDREELKTINADKAEFPHYYQLLKREELRDSLKKTEGLVASFLGRDTLLDKICSEQIERLQDGKKQNITSSNEKLNDILKLIAAITSNKEEIMEREISIAALGDSKKFEKCYHTKVCSLLKRYRDYNDILMDLPEKKEIEKRILEEYKIVKNPSYIYMKGKAKIWFKDGSDINISQKVPIALYSRSLPEIKGIKVEDSNIMTVENLTSYNRMNQEDYFYLYLSGYHNLILTDFLKLLFISGEGSQSEYSNDYKTTKKQWYHFGDIDPDGIYIYENLISKTNIPFQMFQMDLNTLKKYKKYTKKLEKNDCQKAQSLLKNKKYKLLIEYMLQQDSKLEQEIVSWFMDKV